MVFFGRIRGGGRGAKWIRGRRFRAAMVGVLVAFGGLESGGNNMIELNGNVNVLRVVRIRLNSIIVFYCFTSLEIRIVGRTHPLRMLGNRNHIAIGSHRGQMVLQAEIAFVSGNQTAFLADGIIGIGGVHDSGLCGAKKREKQ